MWLDLYTKEENLLFVNLCLLLVFLTSNRCVINKPVVGRGELKVKREQMSLNQHHILHKHMQLIR